MNTYLAKEKNYKWIFGVFQHQAKGDVLNNIPQLNIIFGMSQGEQQIIKVQIHHELIGNHNFELSGKTHTSDLRLHILENSPLYIHENFHLELQGTRLQ